MTLVIRTLYSFTGGTDGGGPGWESLTMDANGDLFGTTQSGGANGDGTVFELTYTPGVGYASAPNILVSFNNSDGANPSGGLITDGNGDLFGTTAYGGLYGGGTVFEIPKTGTTWASTPTTLVNFNGTDGSYLVGSLLMDTSGDLFGTADLGGAAGVGTVFEVPVDATSPTGYASVPTTLVTFNGDNGAYPGVGSLIADANGDLFGTTEYGGGLGAPYDGGGTVFEIPFTPGTGYASTPVTLARFDNNNNMNGDFVPSDLVADAKGDLFGATFFGGTSGQPGSYESGYGTVFEIPKTATGYGPLTTLVSFNGADGVNIAGSLLLDASGDIFGETKYGGAFGDGSVFEVAADPTSPTGYASAPTTVASFNGTDGTWVIGGLLAGANGALFGTTFQGGSSGAGTIFEVVNDPGPAAANVAVTEGHGQTLDLTALINGLVTPGLPGDTETLTAVSAATGSASLAPDGTVTYTVPASGTDSITYTVADAYGDTATGQVAVTVDPGPSIAAGSVIEGHGQSVNLTALIDGLVTPGLPGDTDSLVYAAATSGTATLGPNRSVTYVAPQSGTDTIAVVFVDQYGDVAHGQVAVTVDPGPTAGTLQLTLPPSQTLDLTSLILGVVDRPGLPGDTLTLTGVNASNATGTVSFSNNDLSYTAPATGGTTSFTYTVSDQYQDTATGTVTVTTSPGLSGGGATIPLTGSGNVVDGGSGNITVSGGTGGNVVLAGNGNDTVTLPGGDNRVVLGNGNNAVSVSGPGDSVTLGKGNNALTLAGPAGSATAGNGDNTALISGAGGTAAFGDGNNSVAATASGVAVAAGKGANKVALSGASDDATLGNGNNTLSMTGASDAAILGNGSNNVMIGGPNGSVTAGNGGNTLSMTGASDAAILGNGNNNVQIGGPNGSVTAGNGGNTLSMTGASDAAILGNGNNNVQISGPNGTVTAGNGNNGVSLSGSNGTASLGNGNNALSMSGPAGSATLGNGNNTATLTGLSPTAAFGDGNNGIAVSGANAQVTAGNGNNTATLTGSSPTAAFGDGKNGIAVSGANAHVTVGNGNNLAAFTGGHAGAAFGTGTNSIAVAGTHNVISVGRPAGIAAAVTTASISTGPGQDFITSGLDGGNDTFILNNTTTSLILQGTGNQVFTNGGTDVIVDTLRSNDALLLSIGALGASVTIADFSVTSGVVDLAPALAAALHWTNPAQIAADVTTDHHGGATLSLGGFGAIDFLGVAPGKAQAANFQIG